MLDALFVLLTLVLGGLGLLYVRGCAALVPGDRNER